MGIMIGGGGDDIEEIAVNKSVTVNKSQIFKEDFRPQNEYGSNNNFATANNDESNININPDQAMQGTDGDRPLDDAEEEPDSQRN